MGYRLHTGALVAGMIGFTLYQAININSQKPELSVTVERVDQLNGSFLLIFRVINQGGATAASVKVQGQLKSGGEAIETSAVTLDYVPSHSERGGGLIFDLDPRTNQLELKATSYHDP